MSDLRDKQKLSNENDFDITKGESMQKLKNKINFLRRATVFNRMLTQKQSMQERQNHIIKLKQMNIKNQDISEIERTAIYKKQPYRRVTFGQEQIASARLSSPSFKQNNDLSAFVISSKSPLFDQPIMQFSPKSTIEPSSFLDISQNSNSYSASTWKKIQNVITNKYSKYIPIKEMLETNEMKQRIFNKIYQKLTNGKKLKRYDLYFNEEQGRHELKIMKQQVQEKQETVNKKNFKKSKQYKQIQIQNQLVNIQKQADVIQQQEKASILSYMQTKHDKNHTLKAIKAAVDSNQITREEANAIILQEKKLTNEEIINNAVQTQQGFRKHFKQLKSKLTLENAKVVQTQQSRPTSALTSKNKVFLNKSMNENLNSNNAMFNKSQMNISQRSPVEIRNSVLFNNLISQYHRPISQQKVIRPPTSTKSTQNIKSKNQDYQFQIPNTLTSKITEKGQKNLKDFKYQRPQLLDIKSLRQYNQKYDNYQKRYPMKSINDTNQLALQIQSELNNSNILRASNNSSIFLLGDKGSRNSTMKKYTSYN